MKYGGFLKRWCHASYSACPIRIRCAWARTFSKTEKPPFSISKIEYPDTCERTLRSWRYCVGARLKFFAARDGPAVKSHSTTTQYRQLRTTTLQRIFPSVLSNDYNLFNFLHIFSLGNKINRMLNSSSLSWYVLSPTVEARTWNYRAERMLKSLIAARV